jgi:hypothetical protein
MPSLTVEAPSGSHFESEEVRTAKGTQSLGEHPILVWDNLDAARAYYGDEGVKDILDGTSLRVSFQSIARRMTIAKKTDDEIAKAQIDFRPGKRQGGVSTPVSRAKRVAGEAAEKLGEKGDLVSAFLERVARGEISDADLEALSK